MIQIISKIPLNSFCVGHLLMAMRPPLSVVCVNPVRSIRENYFFFCQLLSIVDGFGVRDGGLFPLPSLPVSSFPFFIHNPLNKYPLPLHGVPTHLSLSPTKRLHAQDLLALMAHGPFGGSLFGTQLPSWPTMVSVPTTHCLSPLGDLQYGLKAHCPLPPLRDLQRFCCCVPWETCSILLKP